MPARFAGTCDGSTPGFAVVNSIRVQVVNFPSAPRSEVAPHPKKNPFRMTNSCATSSNREVPGKMNERSYRFVTNRKQVELTAAERSASTFNARHPNLWVSQ